MKILLAIVVALAVALWVVSWFRHPEALATSAAQPWPGGLGTLETVAARFPPIRANEASKQLAALAAALPKNEVVEIYVGRELVRGEQSVGAPPALPDVSRIRELLLKEDVVWSRPGGIAEVGDAETQANRAVQMTVARALVARALAKAHRGDPAAWEELHAVWRLARSLDPQPQMLARTAALAMLRMVNAVAWKMPLPVPAWFAEVQQRDAVPALVIAFQYQAAAYWNDGLRIFPTRFLANSVEKDRRIAESVFNETRCDVRTPANDLGVDLSFVWRRAFRYRAEREATANALRVREGRPIETASRCSDGAWTFDGTTLRFSRIIDTELPDRPLPLTLRVKP